MGIVGELGALGHSEAAVEAMSLPFAKAVLRAAFEREARQVEIMAMLLGARLG